MTFFFGIAMVEIVVAVLPGGSLSPMKKAIVPLMSEPDDLFVLYVKLHSRYSGWNTRSHRGVRVPHIRHGSSGWIRQL